MSRPYDAEVTATRRTTYQHGHLPEALGAAVIGLVQERGVRGFTLAEAARRSGVSGSAPYRHYVDRDALLAAVATQIYDVFAARLTAAKRKHRTPLLQIAAMAAEYVAFARDDAARFEILFNSGIDKAAYPALEDSAERAEAEFVASVAALCNHNATKTRELALALRACAHGYATFVSDGTLERSGIAPDDVASVAAKAVRTLAHAFVARSP